MASESRDRKLRGWNYLGPDASEVIKNARFNHPGFDGQQEPHGPYDGPEGERRRMREVADEMRSKMDKPKKRGRGPSGESPAKPKAKPPVPAIRRGMRTGGGATEEQAKRRIELGKERDEYARVEKGADGPRGGSGAKGLSDDVKRAANKKRVKTSVQRQVTGSYGMGGIKATKFIPARLGPASGVSEMHKRAEVRDKFARAGKPPDRETERVLGNREDGMPQRRKSADDMPKGLDPTQRDDLQRAVREVYDGDSSPEPVNESRRDAARKKLKAAQEVQGLKRYFRTQKHTGVDGKERPPGFSKEGKAQQAKGLRDAAGKRRSDKAVKQGQVGLGLTKASDESAARRLVRNVGRVARVAGPLGAAVGALAASDPLEAAGMPVDRAEGRSGDLRAASKGNRSRADRMAREEKAYYERKKERALERMGISARPKPPKVKK